MSKVSGTGAVALTDYKTVKWVGKSKDGKAVTIKLTNALNMGDIDWTFAEKGEIVAQVTFTACYENTDETATATTEPWEIETNGQTAGNGEIVLGTGIFYVGETAIALNRGGGNFKVAREFRQITADGDRGPVKGRVTIDGSTATLQMNVLTMLTRVADLYVGIDTTT